MASTEIKTGDHDNFNNAQNTVQTLNKAIAENQKKISNSKTKLSDDSIFAGPISVACNDELSKLDSQITGISTNFSSIQSYLGKAVNNYQEGDKAAITYLSIKDGKIVETNTPPAVLGSGNEIITGLSGNSNQEKVYDYLKKAGFNSAVISGIMANINAESGFQISVDGDGGWSHGLCQWYRGRNDNLHSYCKKNNLKVDSVEGQMAFMMHELNTGYKNSVLEKLKNVPNTKEGAYEAASIWTKYYEIPANTNTQAHNRGKTAQSTYWDIYGNK